MVTQKRPSRLLDRAHAYHARYIGKDASEPVATSRSDPPTSVCTQTPKETAAERGLRMADESLNTCSVKQHRLRSTIRKLLSARVRLPRAAGSMAI